jgi:hypothetical protein
MESEADITMTIGQDHFSLAACGDRPTGGSLLD